MFNQPLDITWDNDDNFYVVQSHGGTSKVLKGGTGPTNYFSYVVIQSASIRLSPAVCLEWPMFSLTELNCFIAAAEETHFGRAALRLNMTQPTLSRQIDALEHVLKVKLFERANRSVKLTAAGRIFLPEAKRIMAQVESATILARHTWRGESGVIRLGYTATAAFVDLPLILNKAAKMLPDVKIFLKENTSAVQKDALLSGLLDVAILRPPIDKGTFDTLLLRRERFVAALHRNDPRAAKKKLSLKDFDGRDFVMYSADGASYSFRILTAMFENAQVNPHIVHHVDQSHTILSLVSAGMGAALVPDSLAILSFPNLVFRDVQCDPPNQSEMFMCWRAENKNPALPSFLSLCRSLFKS